MWAAGGAAGVVKIGAFWSELRYGSTEGISGAPSVLRMIEVSCKRRRRANGVSRVLDSSSKSSRPGAGCVCGFQGVE
jgi:hypothetical protein